MKVLFIHLIAIFLLTACVGEKSNVQDIAYKYFKATSEVFQGKISGNEYKKIIYHIDSSKLPKKLADEFDALRDISAKSCTKSAFLDFMTNLALNSISAFSFTPLNILQSLLQSDYVEYKSRFSKFKTALIDYGISKEWIENTLKELKL